MTQEKRAVEQVCCGAWQYACERGSDNEMYGPLIFSNLKAGCVDIPIRFCPWCGAKKGEERIMTEVDIQQFFGRN